MPAGRPSKLTTELQSKIVEAIIAGNYAETAAEANGITEQTFWNWMLWGRNGKGEPYIGFFEAITRARAEAEMRLVGVALGGDMPGVSNGPAKAALNFLERTRARKFGAKVAVKVEEELAEFLDVAERVLAPEDLSKLLEAYSARARGEPIGEAAGSAADEAPVH